MITQFSGKSQLLHPDRPEFKSHFCHFLSDFDKLFSVSVPASFTESGLGLHEVITVEP